MKILYREELIWGVLWSFDTTCTEDTGIIGARGLSGQGEPYFLQGISCLAVSPAAEVVPA